MNLNKVCMTLHKCWQMTYAINSQSEAVCVTWINCQHANILTSEDMAANKLWLKLLPSLSPLVYFFIH